jgi:hypothetical protein
LTEEIYTLSEQEGMFVMMIRYHFTFWRFSFLIV